tara:strand:- start:599 stop:811 length:213 start_codon:yes stop_codon:yes gene_type:complete
MKPVAYVSTETCVPVALPAFTVERAKAVAEYLGAPDPYLPTADGNNAHVASVMRASGDCGFSAINLARRS